MESWCGPSRDIRHGHRRQCVEPVQLIEIDVVGLQTCERILDRPLDPGGRQTLAAAQDNQIWLWRIGDGTLLRKLRFHHWAVNLAIFSPDGKILVSGAADPHVTGVGRGEIAIWRARDGELLHTYDPGGRVWAAALSPDSRLIAYGLAEPATVVVARNHGEALSEQAQTQQR